MLAELLHWLVTPASLAARRDGTLADSVALWARGRRQRRAWRDHETLTRAAIAAAVDACRRRRIVVVLGSGLLRDVPIELLRARFETVVLVDLVHLATVRARALLGGWRNVRFLTRDLGGRAGPEHGGPLDFIATLGPVDLVVSANLLSQIGVAARARAEERAGRDLGGPLPEVAAEIAAHVAGLAALPCPACLVTDTAFEVRDRAGRVVEHHDLMHGVALPPVNARWHWPVCPFGELASDIERVHTVAACRLGDGGAQGRQGDVRSV